MRFVSFLLFATTLFFACRSQTPIASGTERDQDPRWARIDSLEEQGLYASATTLLNEVLAQAQATGGWRTEFRAWMVGGRLQRRSGTEEHEILAPMEARIRSLTDTTIVPLTTQEVEQGLSPREDKSNVPLRQLLHSVLGQAYWDHYQQNRWSVLERTPLGLSSAEENDDLDTWDQRAYMRKVVEHFTASLEPRDTLQWIPAAELRELLKGPRVTDPRDGAGTWFDRSGDLEAPMLFDLLVQRALAVFTNPETRLAEPAWRFRLDDTTHFEVYGRFTYRELQHRDSTSLEFQALRTLLLWERSHLADDQPAARTAATLARLNFVRQHSVLPDKDSLYYASLQLLRSRIERLPIWSEVTLAMAQWHAERAVQYQRLHGDAWKWENKAARDLCDEAIARHPGSFGAHNARVLKARLEAPVLGLQVEKAVSPEVPFHAALTYTNVQRVWLRVVKDNHPETPLNAIGRRGSSSEERERRLLAERPLSTWSVDLPDDGDLNAHMVELPVEGLPLGHYVVLASDGEGFRGGVDRLVYAPFQATRLALSDRSEDGQLDLVVVDRESGTPREAVKAVALVRNQDYTNTKGFIVAAELRTDAEGMARGTLQGQRGQVVWKVSDGPDELIGGSRWMYDRSYDHGNDSLRTFLFTDRAIYRPGQPVYFKGIVTVKRGATTVAKAGYKSKIMVQGMDGRIVDSLVVATDAFGAFHGEFKAPAGLTGTISLLERYGYHSIRVEEYKRPTFEVRFDTLATAPRLESEVTLNGTALSYAGVPLDGAQVRWTVTRTARFPWWMRGGWHFPGTGQRTEIANGTANTDAEGRFDLAFVAQADRSMPQRFGPTFTFHVEAAVTDINGETQQGTTAVNVAHRAIDLVVDLGEGLDRSKQSSIPIIVQNLDGMPVDLPVDVRIVRMVVPEGLPPPARPWEAPDRYLPGQEPRALFWSDPAQGEEAEVLLERKGWRPKSGPFPLDGLGSWATGAYRIELSATDPFGTVVEARHAFTLFDPREERNAFVGRAIHVEPLAMRVEPGGEATLLLTTALAEAHLLMEVERAGRITERRWISLNGGQQLVQLPVHEEDRGGFVVHLFSVERGRVHASTHAIEVPWSNKELQVEWMSFRDKLLPGAKEEWRLRIKGPKGDKVAAQVLATMYDASLDHFVPHAWNMFTWPGYYSQRSARHEPFGAVGGWHMHRKEAVLQDSVRSQVVLNTFGFGEQFHDSYYYVSGVSVRQLDETESISSSDGTGVFRGSGFSAGLIDTEPEETMKDGESPTGVSEGTGSGPQPVRTNFRETAFFLPDLLTDRDGSVVLRFTMPDALTRWKLLGLAHTSDLQLAQFSREAVTSKPLMVVPNLPRFLRQGDRITLTAKINVLEGASVSGTARLELFDPRSGERIAGPMGAAMPSRSFTAAPGNSADVRWTMEVTPDIDLVAVRITATAGSFSDGEERVLPVLTDRLLVTESLPITITKAGARGFVLDKLKNNTSSTLRHHSLTLEFTPNPAWYAVQALPYLMEFPHECAEQVFGRYYANRLAAHVVEQQPGIKKVFEAWRSAAAGNEGALLGALERNPELKGIVLEETPWLMQARDEGERKRRIALLFDLERMAAQEDIALNKLRDMQLPDGSWPWFTGMGRSRLITQHIVTGLGQLEKLNAADLRPDGEIQRMLRQSVRWLDGEVEREHKERLKRSTREELAEYRPAYTDVQYLHARSFFPRWSPPASANAAILFLRERLAATWTSYGHQEQAMIALALHRMGDREVARGIMASLSERAVRDPELGMYWKDLNNGMHWREFPTETQALLIAAYHEVSADADAVEGLKQYLLGLKRTTDWGSTKATAQAIHALLLTGDDLLSDRPAPVITVGGQRVQPDAQEAGTGRFSKQWEPAAIKPEMGTVSVTTVQDGMSWGALHWQYFEQMDAIEAHESPFSIRKEVFLKATDSAGTELRALEQVGLKPGDRLTIRIELRTDRWLDHVHMKDLRAAGLEPVDALSGHRYQGGLGYYQSIRDAGMHFFFDRIGPGTYVFEYDLKVSHAGAMSNGITTAQCMYAPEFGSHSAGMRIEVLE